MRELLYLLYFVLGVTIGWLIIEIWRYFYVDKWKKDEEKKDD